MNTTIEYKRRPFSTLSRTAHLVERYLGMNNDAYISRPFSFRLLRSNILTIVKNWKVSLRIYKQEKAKLKDVMSGGAWEMKKRDIVNISSFNINRGFESYGENTKNASESSQLGDEETSLCTNILNNNNTYDFKVGTKSINKKHFMNNHGPTENALGLLNKNQYTDLVSNNKTEDSSIETSLSISNLSIGNTFGENSLLHKKLSNNFCRGNTDNIATNTTAAIGERVVNLKDFHDNVLEISNGDASSFTFDNLKTQLSTETESIEPISTTARSFTDPIDVCKEKDNELLTPSMKYVISRDLEIEAQNAKLGAPFDAPPYIRAVFLTKYYKLHRSAYQRALFNISLTCSRNECLGILGPNGAGKSTMLELLCGIKEPSNGVSMIMNADVMDPFTRPVIRRVSGVCTQEDIYWNSLSVEDHLKVLCMMKGVKKVDIEEHIHDLLESVGLTNQMKSKASQLSGGMKRRLNIAYSLVGSPKILFFDEPTTGLDPVTKREIWNVILSLKKNRAIIVTTHSMEEAETLCDRIAILANGELVCIGKKEHLKKCLAHGVSLQVTVGTTRENKDIKDSRIERNTCELNSSLGEHIIDGKGDKISLDFDDSDDEEDMSNIKTEKGEDFAINSIRVYNKIEKSVHKNIIETFKVISKGKSTLTLTSAYYGCLIYKISPSDFENKGESGGENTEKYIESDRPTRIANIFKTMEIVSSRNPYVLDWNVVQSSLESIFLSIVGSSTTSQILISM